MLRIRSEQTGISALAELKFTRITGRSWAVGRRHGEKSSREEHMGVRGGPVIFSRERGASPCEEVAGSLWMCRDTKEVEFMKQRGCRSLGSTGWLTAQQGK